MRFIIILSFILFTACGQEEAPPEKNRENLTIHFGTEGAYPPFNYIDQSGELQGFDIEIARAICKKLAAECTYTAQSWDGLIPALMAKKYDAIVASISITEDRKRSVLFSDKYYNTPIRFVTRKDKTLIISKEGLAGKKIGAQRSTTSAKFLREKFGSDIKINLYDTQESAILDLKNGRVDALLADALVLSNWLNSKDGADYGFRGQGYYVDEGIAVATRKDSQVLIQKINQALNEIHADGTYQQVTEKFFPYSIY